MKVYITDIATSILLYNKYGYHGLQKTKFEWQGRCDKLTDEQIEKGKKENPEARVFDVLEFSKMYQDEDVVMHDGYTVRLWPVCGGLGLFMHFMFPAYTEIPKGETGNLVMVDIDDD